MNRDFTINVTEERQRQILEYLNDMQEGVDKNRNKGSHEGFLNSMHFRDGFLRALSILGVDYKCSEYEMEDGSTGLKFDKIKKDIFRD